MKQSIFCAALAAMLVLPAQAKVSAEEARQLGGTLTELGAVKAGNEKGTIPAYAGALPASKYPSDYKPNSGRWTDPYRDEKPLYTITAANMAQYEAVLNEGSRELLKRFPSYQMRVFPTHRDMAYPQFWLDKTVKNATTMTVGGKDGDTVEGGWGGIPFPIPKDGLEAMWNHRARYFPPIEFRRSKTYFINSGGSPTLVSDITSYASSPWSEPQGRPEEWLQKTLVVSNAPARSVGQIVLRWSPLNYATSGARAWAYTPGQRRVRLTPEATYDTPAASYGGTLAYDEFGGFDGRYDRFDWKLAGKQEMLIPYHTYNLNFNAAPESVLGKQHPNPESQRWELHRVWVVEATQKKTSRHIFSKRRLYLDEDSWKIVASEGWDQAGKLYRLAFANSAPLYGDKLYPATETFTFYDLNKGTYSQTQLLGNDPKAGVFLHDRFPSGVPLDAEGIPGYGVR